MADEIHLITSHLAASRGPDSWERRTIERPIAVQAVQDGLLVFIGQVRQMLETTCEQLGEFQLEEVSFTAQVSADGEFKLVGTEVPGLTGGLRFTMKRKHTMQTADLNRVLVGTEPVDDVEKNQMRSHLTTLSSDPPVRIRHEGIVPVAEQNLPLPVVEVGF